MVGERNRVLGSRLLFYDCQALVPSPISFLNVPRYRG